MARADALLQQRITQKSLCRDFLPNAQFTIVNNVFRKFYIGEIQPYIASVYQQAEHGLQLLDDLTQQLATVEAYDTFWLAVYQADASEWQRFKRSIQMHTESWQALLKQCGSLPQA